MEDRTKNSIFYEAKKMIKTNTTVRTDGLQAYNFISEIIPKHQKIICKDKKEVSKLFSWVHTAISNFRKILLEIYHGMKSKYFQNYLNEFYYNLIGVHLI